MAENEHSSPADFVVHTEPIWREKANFIINAELQEQDLPRRYEQLWARQLTESQFEICCIPFFLFDVSLGDIVETGVKGSRKYVLDRVVSPSGRYVFRVWFGESFRPREEIGEELSALGALLEWSSANLLALDASDAAHAQRVADFLQEREDLGQLRYETGQSA